MKLYKHLNQQLLSREISARSGRQRYERGRISERQVNRVLDIFFDIVEETLTIPGGKISLTRLGIFEAVTRMVGGALKQGEGEAKLIKKQTCSLRWRPPQRLKIGLKANTKRVKPDDDSK